MYAIQILVVLSLLWESLLNLYPLWILLDEVGTLFTRKWSYAFAEKHEVKHKFHDF